jgi:hypothetical protein
VCSSGGQAHQGLGRDMHQGDPFGCPHVPVPRVNEELVLRRFPLVEHRIGVVRLLVVASLDAGSFARSCRCGSAGDIAPNAEGSPPERAVVLVGAKPLPCCSDSGFADVRPLAESPVWPPRSSSTCPSRSLSARRSDLQAVSERNALPHRCPPFLDEDIKHSPVLIDRARNNAACPGAG